MTNDLHSSRLRITNPDLDKTLPETDSPYTDNLGLDRSSLGKPGDWTAKLISQRPTPRRNPRRHVRVSLPSVLELLSGVRPPCSEPGRRSDSYSDSPAFEHTGTVSPPRSLIKNETLPAANQPRRTTIRHPSVKPLFPRTDTYHQRNSRSQYRIQRRTPGPPTPRQRHERKSRSRAPSPQKKSPPPGIQLAIGHGLVSEGTVVETNERESRNQGQEGRQKVGEAVETGAGTGIAGQDVASEVDADHEMDDTPASV